VVPVAAVPGPPAAPEICNVLSTICTVRYQLPADEGDAPVTGYQVQRRGVTGKDKREWETVNKTLVPDLELVDDHLKPLSRYQFRVAAANWFGVGEFGPASQFITTDDSVCTIVTTSLDSATQITYKRGYFGNRSTYFELFCTFFPAIRCISISGLLDLIS